MRWKLFFICILYFPMLLTSGCWDRIEVNDIALISGTAFDLNEEGKLQMTVQLVLPASKSSAGGEGGAGGAKEKESFVVETAEGIEPGDAIEKLQSRFSRMLFRGHRRVIVIGEDMARKGLGEVLDSLSRDPQNRLRTHIVVAKGRKGLDLLKMNYPFERVPSEAMRELIKSGAGMEVTIRDFLMAASAEGTEPIAVTVEPTADKKAFEITGIAVFKDLKLTGYLNAEQTRGYLWITGKLNKGTMSVAIPGEEGEISIDIKGAKSKIKPEVEDDKTKINVELSGEGVIYGNGTKLDLTVPKNINLIEQEAKKMITERVRSTLKIVQENYKADIFGFGSSLYQTNPRQWEEIKKKWHDEIFPEAEIIISTDFIIRRTGMSGPPLYLREDEVKK